MIEINEKIILPVDPDRVWEELSDPRAVVSCIPGAELLGENEDGTYDGRMVIRFGPMRVGFRARVALELDEEQKQGRITARGKDQHGATRMHTDATFDVVPDGAEGGSVVTLAGEVKLSGRMAAQIEGGATAVVERMSVEFTEMFTARLVPPPEVDIELTPAEKPGIFARIVAWFRRFFGPDRSVGQ